MEIIREILKDDYVKIGKRKFAVNTITYWAVRFLQGVLGVAWFYVLYVGMWLVFGGN